jgi:hypothetical protein
LDVVGHRLSIRLAPGRGRSATSKAAAATCRVLFIERAAWRVAGLGQPMAFQPAISIEPMTGQHWSWRPALACFRRAAKSRQVVIAGRDGSTWPRRNAP